MPNLERSIDDTVGLLDAEPGVTQACQEVEALAKAGRWERLRELATALEERSDPNEAAPQAKRARFEALADHVEDHLALCTGDAAVDALFRLSEGARKRSVVVPRARAVRVRAFASRLGYGHSPEAFLAALDRVESGALTGDHQELLACWMHEVVLRGHSLGNDARATRFKEVLAKAKHPLASLPLSLSVTEREGPSYMPLYGDKGLGRAMDALTSGTMSTRTVPPPADGATVRATLIDDAGVIERLRTAVRPWSEGKSGKVEAKVFALEPVVDSVGLGSWLLRALMLEATTATARIDCSRVGAEAAFGPLFSAASNGGAYSSGLGGAYGRLAAWTSFAALVGAPASADVAAVDAIGKKCSFLSFRAPGPWFHDIAWDFGALALRPDGRTAAVLAATDAE